MDFYDKLNQFESCNPIFWVVNCQRWKYSDDDFKLIVYGITVTDIGVGLKMYGLDDLTRKALENPELFNGTDLIPTLTYPKRDGLFFLKETECLNGVIAITHGHAHFLINPFAKQQLDRDSIRKLDEVISK
jgi:hypothetical protein